MAFWKRFTGGTPGQNGDPRNDSVRKALWEHGDDGALPRHTLHFVYPQGDDAAPAERIVAYFEDAGLTIGEGRHEDSVVAEHHREVASRDLDALTAQFSADMAGFGWKYDGWECAVETRKQ
jgi:hypothetical protein